jgi:hypothetical protein
MLIDGDDIFLRIKLQDLLDVAIKA